MAASVVLPEPCRPASRITVGGVLANRSRLVSPPRMVTSSSCTILMTCCAGFSAAETSSPLARSRTRAMNSLTTGRATSASSRAMRISRRSRRCRRRTAVLGCAARRKPASAGQRGSRTRYPGYRAVDGRWVQAGAVVGGAPGSSSPGRPGRELTVARRRAASASGWPRRRHVEHVHDLGAERLDPGRAHVQAALAERPAHPPEQARLVVGPDLHHGGGGRRVVDQGDLRRRDARRGPGGGAGPAPQPVGDVQPPGSIRRRSAATSVASGGSPNSGATRARSAPCRPTG